MHSFDTSNSNRWFVHACLMMLLSAPAHSALLLVDTGLPYPSVDGLCGLVEAIDNANDDAATHADCPPGSGADTIELMFDLVLDGSIIYPADGPNGLPSISSELEIQGQGHRIERDVASPPFRIVHVAATGKLDLMQVVIANGLIDTGFDNGGGIFNLGELQIQQSSVINNQVASIFPSGGGVYSDGPFTVINSDITGNSAANDTFSSGGGIFAGLFTVLTMVNTTVQNNSAVDGGGAYVLGSSAIQGSSFSNNTAFESAGALLLSPGIANSAHRVFNSTFHKNTATEHGGAIFNGGDDTEIFGSLFTENSVSLLGGGAIQNYSGELTITNTVLRENRATGTALGGAIGNAALGVVNLLGSEVSGNSSEAKGGGLYTSLANFNVSDSLISGNHAPHGGGFYQGSSNIDGFVFERSSLVDNIALEWGGGGLAEGNQAKSFVINSTVSGNQAPFFGGGLMLNMGGQIDVIHGAIVENVSTEFINSIGGFNAFAGTTNIGSSIIANNLNQDCSATSSSTSLDYNITTDPGGGLPIDRWCAFIPLEANDLLGTDPLLEALAFNGNLGPSHSLLADSPAAGAIPFDCPPELLGVDQRGVARPAGSCDVGPISSVVAVLPSVYFAEDSSLIDDEATAIPPHLVELIVDNTSGTLASPGMPLQLFVTLKGTAALGTDYSTSLAQPTIIPLDAGSWPAPGTSDTIDLDFSVIDDAIAEGQETVELSVSLAGPGVLGGQTNHTVTILDDETLDLVCRGFLSPFENPKTLKKSETTIPLKIRLFDLSGTEITSDSVVAPPEVFVSFGGLVYGDEGDDGVILPVGNSNDANHFVYDEDSEFWIYRLSTSQFSWPDVYTVSVRSGDPVEYVIVPGDEPECVQTFTRN